SKCHLRPLRRVLARWAPQVPPKGTNRVALTGADNKLLAGGWGRNRQVAANISENSSVPNTVSGRVERRVLRQAGEQAGYLVFETWVRRIALVQNRIAMASPHSYTSQSRTLVRP